MKRIVFLCFLALILLGSSKHLKAEDRTIFYANSTEIEVIDYSLTAKKIVFSGEANFEVILGDSETLIDINGATFYEDTYLLYGYHNQNIINPDYDGFMIMYDQHGQELNRVIFNLEEQEEFIGVYQLNNKQIYHLRQSVTNPNGDHEHHFDYFLKFDDTYDGYDYTRFKEKMIRSEIIDEYLYLSHKHHGDYHVAFNHEFDVIYDGVLYGVVNYGTYYDSVDLTLLNGGYLNEDYIIKDISVNYPGYYVINYKDQISTFVLHPIINGIEANMITNEAVTIHVSSGYLRLNDDIYINQTPIDDPGYYVLTIEGINQYVQEIPFTLTSNLEGIYHNQRYNEPKTITFNGLAYLNNRLIESPHTIHESGSYTLTIFGENGYQETHQFEIELKPVAKTLNESLMYVELTLIGIAATGLFIFFIKLRK